MNQAEINQAVSRATGEEIDFIDGRGFSLVDEQTALHDADIEDLTLDWDQIQAEQATVLFRDRQASQVA